MKIKYYLSLVKWFLIYHYYRYIFIPVKSKRIRRQETIKVVFVVAEVSIWKTENLYKMMIQHSRFHPVIALTYAHRHNNSIDSVVKYMETHRYQYEIVDTNCDLFSQFHPDIIFYQKGWDDHIDGKLRFSNNLKSLFCYAMYSFHNSHVRSSLGLQFYNYCWQLYYESNLASKGVGSFMKTGGKNIVVTGLPQMDRDIDSIKRNDPWKKDGKKRIIFAPHFAIENGLFGNATFLTTGDMILQLAKQYKEQVTWVFKPHPLLKITLDKVWGKERTEQYYAEWGNSDFSSIEEGEYDSLFYYSDALIHDCMSFIVEYQYSLKPALYLTFDSTVSEAINEFTQKALDLHYKASSKENIENFIDMIISGGDSRQKEREDYVLQQLTPPYGKTACENIMNAILGVEEYSNC